jgi:hypothetical protein
MSWVYECSMCPHLKSIDLIQRFYPCQTFFQLIYTLRGNI